MSILVQVHVVARLSFNVLSYRYQNGRLHKDIHVDDS